MFPSPRETFVSSRMPHQPPIHAPARQLESPAASTKLLPAHPDAVKPSYVAPLGPQQRCDLVQLLQDKLLRFLHLTDLLGVHVHRVPVPAQVGWCESSPAPELGAGRQRGHIGATRNSRAWHETRRSLGPRD